ncbi:ANTAR domain-containing protein [Streptomyces sp. NBC_00519]|uniref:ANTAR domain-containing protein n=1 Tax=Streptomyces sp. NBC_00519 TaxID=2975764 RepID=UPI0030E0110E
MHRTTLLHEDHWKLRAEATWGNAAAGEDLVALRAENDQLRRALAGRAVVDQARGMLMVLTPCSRGTARDLLVDISRQCHTKLPEVAAATVAAWEGKPLPRQMQRGAPWECRGRRARSGRNTARTPRRRSGHRLTPSRLQPGRPSEPVARIASTAGRQRASRLPEESRSPPIVVAPSGDPSDGGNTPWRRAWCSPWR